MDEVEKIGGSINFTAMGASLGIIKREACRYLERTGSPNSRIQHVLITPATINNYASGYSKEDKSMRALICNQLKLPPMHDVGNAIYNQSELKLRFLTPIRDEKTNPKSNVFQWATLVVEIGKRPNEKNLGFKSCYFHPVHDLAN